MCEKEAFRNSSIGSFPMTSFQSQNFSVNATSLQATKLNAISPHDLISSKVLWTYQKRIDGLSVHVQEALISNG